MSQSAVARRYAQALLEICDEQGNHDAIQAQFARLVELLGEGPEVGRFLANPTIAEADRVELLTSIIDKLELTGPVGNLSRLLLDRGRIDAIDAIHEHFSQILDGRTGRVQATVTTAAPMTDAARARVHAMLTKSYAKEVLLETAVDSELIGGLVIQVGNTVWDGSVRNHLERLRERMLSGYVQ